MMLFTEKINELIFNQKKDIGALVEYLLSFKFKENDSAAIHENFCLYIFLVGSSKRAKLNYPIKIISRESPDFDLIELNEKKEIGLEHTRATLESYKIAESELKKHPKGSMIELCYYSPFKKIPKQNSDIGIVSPNGRLNGEGWAGDQVEYEWAETMLTAINKKIELLNKEHFEKKQENHLFVEDDSPVDFVKSEDKAFDLLRKKHAISKFNGEYTFHKVHIFSQCILVYDFFGEHKKIDLHKNKLKTEKQPGSAWPCQRCNRRIQRPYLKFKRFIRNFTIS